MTAFNKHGEPAFPETGVVTRDGEIVYNGLSQRAYIASQALSGMIAGSAGLVISIEEFAEQSVKLADALLTELEK